jgi:hypothetical protein
MTIPILRKDYVVLDRETPYLLESAEWKGKPVMHVRHTYFPQDGSNTPLPTKKGIMIETDHMAFLMARIATLYFDVVGKESETVTLDDGTVITIARKQPK